MHDNPVSFVLWLCFVLVAAVAGMWWSKARGQELIQRWAATEGLLVLSAEASWFSRGPFFWTASKNQVVYRVTVQDRQGNVRKGWCCCGSWWLGILSDEVTVKWEDERVRFRWF